MSLKDVLSSTGYAQDVVVNASCNPKTGHYSAYDLIQFLDENIETFMNSFKGTARNRFASLRGMDARYNIVSEAHRLITVQKHPTRTQVEKNIARLMREASRDQMAFFDDIGYVLNFEIPLNASGEDHLGDIDVVSYNGKGPVKKLYLLELKRPDSCESLLRCVLEVFSYAMMIKNYKKFIADFGVPPDATIVLAPLFFVDANSQPYVDYCELKNDKRFVSLIKRLEREFRKHVGEKVRNVSIEFVAIHDCELMRDIRARAFDRSLTSCAS